MSQTFIYMHSDTRMDVDHQCQRSGVISIVMIVITVFVLSDDLKLPRGSSKYSEQNNRRASVSCRQMELWCVCDDRRGGEAGKV